VIPAVLLAPVLVGVALAYFAVSGQSSGGGQQVAQGAVGGVFHPVAGNFTPDATTLAGCAGQYSCLEQAFGNLAFRQGPKRALAVFDARLARDRNVERDCHRIVHTIGSATFARFHGNIARTFAQGSSVCASGYYHGILERAFVGITTKARLAEVARSLCVSAGIRRRSFLDYQCRHGLGHGFMIQTGYDLPMALSLCHGLGTGWDEITCTSGAFMENVSTRFGFRSSWLKDDAPLYPCTRPGLLDRRSCYVRATTWMLELNGNDFAKAAGVCKSAGPRWATFCFRGYGRDAVVDSRYRDMARVRELCDLSRGYRGECYYGAARTFSDGSAVDGVRLAARFCTTVPVPDRPSCVAGYGIVVGLLQPTDASRRAACARLAAAEVAACSRAAIAEVDPSGRHSWG